MLSKEQIAELETKHQRVAHIVSEVRKKDADGKEVPAYECVFRKPSRAEYKRFRAMAHNPSTLAEAQENLARACIVHPSPEAFDALLEDFPGIPEAVAQELGKLAGMTFDASVKG